MTIADKLKMLAKRDNTNPHRLSQEYKLNSKSAFDDWFAGRYPPNLHAALWLAKKFKISLDYLADDSLDEPAPGLSTDERRILDTFRGEHADNGLTMKAAERAIILAGGLAKAAAKPAKGRPMRPDELDPPETRKGRA